MATLVNLYFSNRNPYFPLVRGQEKENTWEKSAFAHGVPCQAGLDNEAQKE